MRQSIQLIEYFKITSLSLSISPIALKHTNTDSGPWNSSWWCVYSLFPLLSPARLCNLVLQRRDQCCYLLAYECYTPTEDMKLNTDSCAKIILRNKNLGLEEFRFLLKTIVNSGLGEETSFTRNIIQSREECPTREDSLSETDEIIFDTLDKLFARNTLIPPSQIDILIVNVSMFSPAPSLTSQISKPLQHEGGHQDLLPVWKGLQCKSSCHWCCPEFVQVVYDSYALVISTESMAPNLYCGTEKSMMLTNCLFRSGGCSMLFQNRRSLQRAPSNAEIEVVGQNPYRLKWWCLWKLHTTRRW